MIVQYQNLGRLRILVWVLNFILVKYNRTLFLDDNQFKHGLHSFQKTVNWSILAQFIFGELYFKINDLEFWIKLGSYQLDLVLFQF